MPTQLTIEDHIDALKRGGAVLGEAAAEAGLQAAVPTCQAWNVTELVAHQGMVHRWAAANLRGDKGHQPENSLTEAATAPDVLAWYSDGLDALIETLRSTPEDAVAMVFVKDAPPPRHFWARRQAHETTIHGVDAVAASLGRWPVVSDLTISPAVAADGVDELVCGLVPRRKSKLRSSEPFTLVVRATDTGHAWSLRISPHPVVTMVGDGGEADAVISGTAVQLYLGLWNRGNEIVCEGRSGTLEQWRSEVQVTWS